MNNKKCKIAFVGYGSIGRRHLYNVVYCYNARNIEYSIDLIRSGVGGQLNAEELVLISNVYYKYEDVPSDYDIIFITNPTGFHYNTIERYISKTKHMFIEKPIFDKLDYDIDSLKLKEDSIYYVACPLRYTGIIQYIKNNINLNTVYSARAICSSYLPEWRPGTDYRKSYSANKDLGGGVALDIIHEWDYINFLFSRPRCVFGFSGKYSDLDINSDDLAIYIAKYDTMLVEIHLDYFGRKVKRQIELYTKDDTIIGDFITNSIYFLRANKTYNIVQSRDEYQSAEINHFLDMIYKDTNNDNDIFAAYDTLKCAIENLG